MQEFIFEHFYALLGLVSFLLVMFGFNVKGYVQNLDKQKKIEEVLESTHIFLATIKDKTSTPIDDAIDLGVQFALALLKNKENVVEFSEEEKRELIEALKERIVSSINGK